MKKAGILLIIIAVLFFVQYAIFPSQMNYENTQINSSISDKILYVEIIAIIQVLLLLIAGYLFILEGNKISNFIESTSTYIDDLYKKNESSNDTIS